MKLEFLLQFSNFALFHLSYRNINIISYKESFFEDATSCLCIVMDLADGGDLYNKMMQYKKKGSYMPEKEVWHFFVQMIRGL
jgi:NIMA (never in mitosis gene a)-related kinase